LIFEKKPLHKSTFHAIDARLTPEQIRFILAP